MVTNYENPDPSREEPERDIIGEKDFLYIRNFGEREVAATIRELKELKQKEKISEELFNFVSERQYLLNCFYLMKKSDDPVYGHSLRCGEISRRFFPIVSQNRIDVNIGKCNDSFLAAACFHDIGRVDPRKRFENGHLIGPFSLADAAKRDRTLFSGEIKALRDHPRVGGVDWLAQRMSLQGGKFRKELDIARVWVIYHHAFQCKSGYSRSYPISMKDYLKDFDETGNLLSGRQKNVFSLALLLSMVDHYDALAFPRLYRGGESYKKSVVFGRMVKTFNLEEFHKLIPRSIMYEVFKILDKEYDWIKEWGIEAFES